MITGIKNALSSVWIFLIPILSIIILELCLYIPRATTFWNFIRLASFYAGIYFWQVQRPDAFNLFSTFILGVFADVISATPVGINIVSFLLLYGLTFWLSEYFNIKKFSYSWLLFSAVVLITLLFKAVAVSIFYRTVIPANFLLFEFLLTITLYPLLIRFYMWAELRFIHLEERYEKI